MAALDLPVTNGQARLRGMGTPMGMPETMGSYDSALPHPPAGSAAGPYVWQPPGNQRRVSLELDVVDRVLAEALAGLGSIPRRGVEVGGVLLGSMSEDGTLVITGSMPVRCAHAQGSTYTLSNEEYKELVATVERFTPGYGRPAEAVGFYRSHTREGFGVSMDDVRIFDALFPGDWPVILLVKPSLTRVSQGAFFFREEGTVRRGSSYLEFPFRRRELAGEDALETEETPNEGTPQGEAAAAAQRRRNRMRRGMDISGWEEPGFEERTLDAAPDEGPAMRARAGEPELRPQPAARRTPVEATPEPEAAPRRMGGLSGMLRRNKSAKPDAGSAPGAGAPPKSGDPARPSDQARKAPPMNPTAANTGSPNASAYSDAASAEPRKQRPAADSAGKASNKSAASNESVTGTPARKWQILPFSFLFLLLGLFLGILTAVLMGPYMGKSVANPYALGLRAEQLGQTGASGITKVQLFWNRSAQSISGAVDGTLYIEDGGANKKVVPLSRAQLQGQSIVYDMANRTVHFRLDVRMSENNVFSESLDFRAQ